MRRCGATRIGHTNPCFRINSVPDTWSVNPSRCFFIFKKLPYTGLLSIRNSRVNALKSLNQPTTSYYRPQCGARCMKTRICTSLMSLNTPSYLTNFITLDLLWKGEVILTKWTPKSAQFSFLYTEPSTLLNSKC